MIIFVSDVLMVIISLLRESDVKNIALSCRNALEIVRDPGNARLLRPVFAKYTKGVFGCNWCRWAHVYTVLGDIRLFISVFRYPFNSTATVWHNETSFMFKRLPEFFLENGTESSERFNWIFIDPKNVDAIYIREQKRIGGLAALGQDLWITEPGLSVVLVVELKNGKELTARLVSETPEPKCNLCDMLASLSLH